MTTPIENISLVKQSNESEQNYDFVLSTYSSRLSTTPHVYWRTSSINRNVKIIGIIAACIICSFGMIRLCLLFCHRTNPSNNIVLRSRRTSLVRPQIVTIEGNYYKPDLPPAYDEAIANIETNENKLPSYDELPHRNK